METGVDGLAAFITGGASGLGAEAARLFIERGASVVIADIDEDRGRAVADELGSAASFERLDITDEAHWGPAVDAAAARMGRFDVLVNSAAIPDGGTDIESCSFEHWSHVLDVNLNGIFLGCQHGVRAMRGFGNGGAIINLCSVIGIRAAPTRMAYGVSKAAVAHLTKSVALHCGGKGYNIRCNTLHPGPAETPIMMEQLEKAGGSRESMIEMLSAHTVLGRIASAREVACAIVYLASREASFITATELVIDGGITNKFSE